MPTRKKKPEEPLNFLIIEAQLAVGPLDAIFSEIDRLRKWRKSGGLAYAPVLLPSIEKSLWEGAQGVLRTIYSKGLGKTVVAEILKGATSLSDGTIADLVAEEAYNPKLW